MSDQDFPEAKGDMPTVYQIDFVQEQLSKIVNDPNFKLTTYSHCQDFIDYVNKIPEKKPDWE